MILRKSWQTISQLILITLLPLNTLGKTLVLEYEGESDDYLHGTSVHSIACPSSHQNSSKPHAYELGDRYKFCRVEYANEFSAEESIDRVERAIHWADIINLSLATQLPDYPEAASRYSSQAAKDAISSYEKAKVIYFNESRFFKNTIDANPQKLFVAAAGNGISIAGMPTKGVALSNKVTLVPQTLERDNLIKVASLDIPSFQIENPQPLYLTDYSNYSLDLVEVAAPVEPNYLGEIIDGTSFASPYVARLSQKLLNDYPELSPREIKSILLKSCYIQDVEQALWASQDLRLKKENSIIWTALFDKKRRTREETMAKLPGFIPVKCGGVIVDKLAESCAHNYMNGTLQEKTITSACLKSHADMITSDKKYLNSLRQLWIEREI